MRNKYLGITVISVLLIALVGLWNYKNLVNQPSKKPFTKPFRRMAITTTIRFPGEFEKQEAIWMQWPSEVYNQGSNPINPAMIRVVKAFAPFIRVNVMTRNSAEILGIRKMLKDSGYTGTNVHFYIVNHLSIWTRDVGPIFVKDNNNNLRVVDFKFNNYSRDGSKYYIDVENQVHRLVAQKFGLPLIDTKLISEGGAIESNGKGTMMVPESVALKRNPSMTKLQIENEYKRVLGLKKVIWLKKGLLEDEPITSGHINEFARFANPTTILLAQVLPGDRDANYYTRESSRRLEENYNILKNSTDQDGKHFTIIRIPMPPTLYRYTDKNTPLRSYLNYAVTNGAVILQTYWRPGRSAALKTAEEGIKNTFRRVFPGRTIVGVDSETINMWGGGVHCITQHMPTEW